MFARVAEQFYATGGLTRADAIYAKDWPITRQLLVRPVSSIFCGSTYPRSMAGGPR
jgi:hypothetical protein